MTADDSALVEKYLEFVRVEKRLAARTVELYSLDLAAVEQATRAGVASRDVRNHHIRRWVAQMHSAGRSGRGIALILSGWRGFYAWLGREGLVSSNPVQDVRSPKAPKPLPKALAVDDAVQFADFESDDNAWLEARDAAIVELLYGSGLRVGELMGLDVVAGKDARGWIDMQAAEAHVLGKGSKRRSCAGGCHGHAGLAALVGVAWPFGCRNSGTCGRRSRQCSLRALHRPQWHAPHRAKCVAAAQAAQPAGGPDVPVHPHMLRHSFASHVLQSSGDLRGVQELLGHANITTTQVYTRLDFQHLAKAYDAAHPRAKLKRQP